MRALVTGAGGFVGQWLCAELLRDGWDVHGATLTGAPAGGTLHEWQRRAVYWHDADLRQRDDTVRALDAARPDAIFHLAAVSHVPSAEAEPDSAWATNVEAAKLLLDLVHERRSAGTLDPVVVIVGSSEEYGRHDTAEMPLAEDAELRPQSVYAKTKLAQERAALESWRATGVRVVATRPFNHTGPGQGANFVVPAIMRRARDAVAAGRDTIPVGNLDVVRDFLHVEDVVRAYIFVALRGTPGEVYNICSGVGAPLARIVDEICRVVVSEARGGLEAKTVADVRPVTEAALARAADVPVLVGDPQKLTRDTTWAPMLDWEMAISDMLAFDLYGLEDGEED